MTPEVFEKLKEDFLRKNAALVKAVSEATMEDFDQIKVRALRASLHTQAVSSYADLITKMAKKNKQSI